MAHLLRLARRRCARRGDRGLPLRRWGDDNEAVKATRSNPSWRDSPGRLHETTGDQHKQVARDLDVPPNRISAIVNGTRSITADTALRLGTYFGVSPEVWLGLQIEYDLRLIRQRDGDQIVRSVRTRPAV